MAGAGVTAGAGVMGSIAPTGSAGLGGGKAGNLIQLSSVAGVLGMLGVVRAAGLGKSF